MTGDLDIENAGQFVYSTGIVGAKTREAPVHILANGKCLQLESRTGAGGKQIMEFYPQCPGTTGTVGCIQLQGVGNNTQKLELIKYDSWNGGGGIGNLDRVEFNVFTPLPAPQTQTKVIQLEASQTTIYNDLILNGGSRINGVAPRLAVGISDSVANANTTAETSLIPTSIQGSLTVPANTFEVGSSYAALLAGNFSATNNATIVITLYGGVSGTSFLSDLTFTVPSAVASAGSPDNFEIEIDFTIRALGVGGAASLATNYDFTYNDGSTFSGKRTVTVDPTSNFNTTINNTFNITAQFTTTQNVNNTIRSRMFYLCQIY